MKRHLKKANINTENLEDLAKDQQMRKAAVHHSVQEVEQQKANVRQRLHLLRHKVNQPSELSCLYTTLGFLLQTLVLLLN